VFEIGPAFRAEPSFTSRHETEFTSVDAEISWVTSHEDVMRMEEEMLAYAIGVVKAAHGAEIEAELGTVLTVPSTPFPRMTVADAREAVRAQGHVVTRPGDLDPEGERLASAHIKATTGSEFCFITDYPAANRAFYHMRYEDCPDFTKGFDLLWNGLEITTGAQREHRYDRLVAQAQERGYGLHALEDYVNFFRYGCPPHGGFGLGLARLLMVLLGLPNIREVTYLSRSPTRLRP
jgi:aspartyl/asparaginyl-tRNA synthetase